jgi:hypothetical protein
MEVAKADKEKYSSSSIEGVQSCLSCRVIGTVVCASSSAYLLYHTPKHGVHRYVYLAAAGCFGMLGMARAILDN